MSFAAPTLLAALALLVPVLIAFLVRRRREVVRVPSTILFRLGARSVARSRRIRNLRRLASLIACLLGVAALVFAAARPTAHPRGETVAFVIDVSASMGAGGRSAPIVEARRHVARVLATAASGDRYAIVSAGASPERLAGPAESGPLLDAALERVQPTRGGADLRAAVELAASLLANEPGSRIVVLDDGGERAADLPADFDGIPVTERILSAPARDNLGIGVFATRPPADATSDDEREALIAVATSSEVERAARVTVTVSGQEIARRRVVVPARGEAEVRVRVRASATEVVATVEPDDAIPDALASDDRATLSDAAHALPRALLIGRCSDGACRDEGAAASEFFVEKALAAAGVKDIVHASLDLQGREILPGDVLVALDEGPTRHIDAAALYIGTRTGVIPVTGVRELGGTDTHLRSLESGDALLRGVSLDGVTTMRAMAANVPTSGRALVDLDGGSVVLAGGAGAGAWVYVGIDPAKSDLVLRVAFPVLVANALHVLGGAAAVISAETVARGEIGLRAAAVAPSAIDPAPPEKAPRWRLPASPPALLAFAAALLLALEAWGWRKGWAS